MSPYSINYFQQYLFRKPFGIHSPFLYAFSNACIFNDPPAEEFIMLENIRKNLKNNESEILVTDYGMGPRFGPRKEKTNNKPLQYSRQVKSIARNSLQQSAYCRLFYRIVQYLQPETIIELGTSLGLTTCYFALGNPKARVFSLEGCPKTAEIAKETFAKAGVSNVELITGDFSKSLPVALKKCPSPGIVYIDGDHSFEGVLRNFTNISNHLNAKSVVIVDDIRLSKPMYAAWKQMAAWENTTMALDMGKIGLLFFNPALSKQLVRIGF